ncbi:polysaccharide biosynthesis C-terminal domain-containing protein [Cohnella sp. GCM10027633]|uniref:oligosaccharide flippase family protein n=1 Tax=unclassified Cohnella TaxID=2636738 RepID=UPI0036325F0B
MSVDLESGQGKQSAKQALWQGAALLGGAALLSKVIGTLQKIPLQNMAGDETFGLYSAVYALAIMWMTLAAAGVPVAVSALVAERVAASDEHGARRVLRWSLGLLVASGFVMFAILCVFAEQFASWMGVESAASAIRMSSIALLFAPATAVLRGYRQGRMEMARPALSQIAEQVARVAFMLIMLIYAVRMAWSPASTAAAVHGGLAAGAVAGLIAMLWRWPWRRTEPIVIRGKGAKSGKAGKPGGAAASDGARKVQLPESRGKLLRRIAAVAVPVALASVVAPLIGLIDAFSIPRLLGQHSDTAAALSLSEFGVYNRGIALNQLVIMAAAGAAAALVPALTAARARGDGESIVAGAHRATRLAWWFGASAAVGLAVLAQPINVALFADDNGTIALALLAVAALGGTLQAVSSALLQGLGDMRSPAVNLAAAALLKLALNAALVPAYGIRGAAIALAAAFAAAATLNALSLRQRVRLPAPRLSVAGRSAAALAAMAAAVAACALLLGALTGALPARASALLTALPCIAVGAAVFAASLVAFGAALPREWRVLPGLSGTRVDRWLDRVHTYADAVSNRNRSKEG